MKVSLGLLLLLFTACTGSNLTVHTDYLSHENLASYRVNTPDPRLDNPPIGQRLIVEWLLPRYFLYYEDLHLEITLRYRNRQELMIIVPVTDHGGTYVYALLNQDYILKRGIATYKVDLIGDGYILDAWVHQMWTPLIRLNQQGACEEEVCDDEDEMDDF